MPVTLNEEMVETSIQAHAEWFDRLKDAIATGRSSFTPEQVRQVTECEFGKWMYAELKPLCDERIFGEIRDAHAAFHRKASDFLFLALQGTRARAAAEVAVSGELTRLSENLCRLLKGLTLPGR